MTFIPKINYFQKQGDYFQDRETVSKTGSLPAKQGG